MKLIASHLLLMASVSCALPPQPPPSTTVRPTVQPDTETRNANQRDLRAAEIQRSFDAQEIPVRVVAVGSKLRVSYHRASASYFPYLFEAFCEKQERNIAGLALSGFESVELSATDSYGSTKYQIFPLADCQSVKK